VLSSVIAAWTDVSSVLAGSLPAVGTGVSLNSLQTMAGAVRGLNIGYLWMLLNCLTSAAYVSAVFFFAVRANINMSFIL
jgi:GDP-mannose transporter